MPRKGPAYPISPEWRSQVRRAINDLIKDKNRDDVTSDKTFAKVAHVSPTALSESLNKESVQSTIMPEINVALGWPKPRVLSTPDELEIWAAVEALDERELGRILGMAEATLARLRKGRSQRS